MGKDLTETKIYVLPLSKHSRYLMCPVCYKLTGFKLPTAYNIMCDEELTNAYLSVNINLKCKECNNVSTHIQLDENIAPIIVELNKKGYFTRFCCEGHNIEKESKAYIMFRTFEPTTLPEDWDYYITEYPIVYCTYTGTQEKETLLFNLRKWVNELPVLANSETECLVGSKTRHKESEKIAKAVWESIDTETYLLAKGIDNITNIWQILRILKVKDINNEALKIPKFKSRSEQKIYIRKLFDDKYQAEIVASIPDDAKLDVFSLDRYF